MPEERAEPSSRVFSIPPGVPFLPALADALLSGRLVPGFAASADPLALASVTIFVPTRRAARMLRRIFVERATQDAAILPRITPLGEFDEDAALFDAEPAAALDLAPPIGTLNRILTLAPLVQAWKSRIPAHVAARYEEEVVVPTSAADAIWLSRDLASLMDEVETEGTSWGKLAGIAADDLSGWWQVTRDFLAIVTDAWPEVLAARQRSNPAAHRAALIASETGRLERNPPAGPVIAAGSTGSIPATARLLAAIARLPQGAVVLPGLDRHLDEASWRMIGAPGSAASVFGHPQFGLGKLMGRLEVGRGVVTDLASPAPGLSARAALVSEALRPAETTDLWAARRADLAPMLDDALAGVTLVEAANEQEEATTIAIALRRAIEPDGKTAALVTSDRDLARRVSAELLRFGIQADDSAGRPLSATPPAIFLGLVAATALKPGDPLPILSLIKHPLLCAGLPRGLVRRIAGHVELVALRGGVGRPDAATLDAEFEQRLAAISALDRQPFWMDRLRPSDIDAARDFLKRIATALAPLAACRQRAEIGLSEIARLTVEAAEALACEAEAGVAALYDRDAGEALAALLRDILDTETGLAFAPGEWPDILAALVATASVKPARGADSRVAIWGALEARLQTVDTLVVGGLNEGIWPRRPEPDRFLSRLMKAQLDLEPPERRIGLAAHDFMMALGASEVVLTRAARAGDAPSSASRWLQRLQTFAGPEALAAPLSRGRQLLAWARGIDEGFKAEQAKRPQPAPPVEARPRTFSVTEIETLRRDPYAVYARRVLKLRALDPLLRDPGAADRGSLFHAILHRFTEQVPDPDVDDALDRLVAIGRAVFDETRLPADVDAVWWPRFRLLAEDIVRCERSLARALRRVPEAQARATAIGDTGATLSGRADRVDLLPGGMASIYDYKTGAGPSRKQAHVLLAPQLALEGALLARGAFQDVGKAEPSDLAFIRLKPNGEALLDSILSIQGSTRSASDLAADAWARLERLVRFYDNPAQGYLSRALPFREGETDGDYDHLARVLEWSAGSDGDADGGDAE